MAITENARSRGFYEARRPDADDAESGNTSAKDDLSALLRRALGTPMHEIDELIGEFKLLRKKLETDANRVQREIIDYAELSRRVRRITATIHETVEKMGSDAKRAD
jgi:hypothetical protein